MADICLILEGTYPYVSGGVSSCVHQLICKLSKVNFNIVYLGASPDELLSPKYEIPPNVLGIQELYLFDNLVKLPKDGRRELNESTLASMQYVHDCVNDPNEELENFEEKLESILGNRNFYNLLRSSLRSKGLWHILKTDYSKVSPDSSFIDFFYTWRFIFQPIYRILSFNFPPSDLYHSLCTGYAGFAGSIAKIKNPAPYIVSEHGIYTHEREMEISEADWIHNDEQGFSVDSVDQSLKQWWISKFRNLSKICYHFSDSIITLYKKNQIRQISDGARETKCSIIPNGISSSFKNIRSTQPDWEGRKSEKPFRISFVGRVVPIKDVKLLIKSVSSLKNRYENFEVLIVGPYDEDLSYYEECMELVKFLDLQTFIRFTGKQDVKKIYEETDCLVLSSISEAQPLVVLEANLAGIPVVSTDVGSCDELLNGKNHFDTLIGPSGMISPIGDPESIAENIYKLIESPELWKQMSQSGIKRVSTFYDENDLIKEYESLYNRLILSGGE